MCYTKGSHSFAYHQTRAIPAFTPQPQSISTLWPVLIVPTHGRMARLSWVEWLVRPRQISHSDSRTPIWWTIPVVTGPGRRATWLIWSTSWMMIVNLCVTVGCIKLLMLCVDAVEQCHVYQCVWIIIVKRWNMHCAGTTDNACPLTHNPSPSEDEILFILNEVRNYLSPDVNGWWWSFILCSNSSSSSSSNNNNNRLLYTSPSPRD